ncbi:MAG TPA: FecR family protein [Chthoniobacteraceae bacterium]|jgi:hypothetical protein
MIAFALVATAAPLSSATVTRLENSVKYGEVRGRESVTRRAAVADIVRASNFLLTETDARAELQYEDGSIVRVGQNTVFSFEADSRTLTLQKGSFIFFVPKGSGGGTIKTPSLTAAITGTVGKVSRDTIAVLEGEVTLIPSGRKVRAGYFARRNADGTITIAKFDPSKAMDGRLMAFNGPMPGFAEDGLTRRGPRFDASVLSRIETLNRTQNLPSSIEQFFPDEPDRTPAREEETKVFVPPPRETPHTPPPTRPGRGGGGGGEPAY